MFGVRTALHIRPNDSGSDLETSQPHVKCVVTDDGSGLSKALLWCGALIRMSKVIGSFGNMIVGLQCDM
jgi:hypothetical protein